MSARYPGSAGYPNSTRTALAAVLLEAGIGYALARREPRRAT